MRTFSDKFRQLLISGNRHYLANLDIVLSNGRRMSRIYSEDIWENGITFDTASSSPSKFDIGSAIIGSCTIVLNNITDKFTGTDFNDATITVYIGLEGDTTNNNQNYYLYGKYYVDSPDYNGSLITLNCLDAMSLFDKDFTLTQFPKTIDQIVTWICNTCGVSRARNTFPNGTYQITKKLSTNKTCREVLGYLSTICAGYCFIDKDGKLDIRQYEEPLYIEQKLDGGTFNTNTTPYSDGDTANGGNFITYEEEQNYDGGLFYNPNDNSHFFGYNFNTKYAINDVVITGISIQTVEGGVHIYGTNNYVLKIDENPFINENNVQTIGQYILSYCNGTPLRDFSITTIADATVEVGDYCTFSDHKGNHISGYITQSRFSLSGNHTISCGVESVSTSKRVRYKKTESTEEILAKTEEQITEYIDTAIDENIISTPETVQEQFYEEVDPRNPDGLFYDRETIDEKISQSGGSTNIQSVASVPQSPQSNVLYLIQGEVVVV